MYIKNNLKLTIKSIVLNCDDDFVQECQQVPGNLHVFSFKPTRQVDSFFLDIQVKSQTTERILFDLKYKNACRFLNNPFINNVFSRIYNDIVVNNSYFKCPIKPGIYYLSNKVTPNVISFLHPAGRYRLTVRINTSQSEMPFIMEIVCNYNIVAVK